MARVGPKQVTQHLLWSHNTIHESFGTMTRSKRSISSSTLQCIKECLIWMPDVGDIADFVQGCQLNLNWTRCPSWRLSWTRWWGRVVCASVVMSSSGWDRPRGGWAVPRYKLKAWHDTKSQDGPKQVMQHLSWSHNMFGESSRVRTRSKRSVSSSQFRGHIHWTPDAEMSQFRCRAAGWIWSKFTVKVCDDL